MAIRVGKLSDVSHGGGEGRNPSGIQAQTVQQARREPASRSIELLSDADKSRALNAIADAVEAAKLLAKPKKPIEVILKVRGSEAELIWSSRKSYVPVPDSFALDNQKQLESVGR